MISKCTRLLKNKTTINKKKNQLKKKNYREKAKIQSFGDSTYKRKIYRKKLTQWI